jgi:uncharacterized SAM-binding protein YcdF (DUF218 family)
LFTIFKWFFRTVTVVTLLIATVVAIGYFYPEKFLCVDSGPVSADVIVVLGGGLHERPGRAAALYRLRAAPRVIVSGAGDNWINRTLLIKDGVPAQAIEMEGASTTTRENAAYTIKLLRRENVHRAILVTTWYHSRRALKTFEHYAPDITFYSRPSYYAFAREEWSQHGNGHRMRMEFLKLPGYWIWYGINPF